MLLYQPDVSLQLGSFHLQELAESYTEPGHMLAAYNAGASRVSAGPGATAWTIRRSSPSGFPSPRPEGMCGPSSGIRSIYRSLYPWTSLGEAAARLEVGEGPS